MSDDTGYGDLGPYGGGAGRGMPTPNIDRMARHPVENILAYLEGKPQFVVNPDVLAGRG